MAIKIVLAVICWLSILQICVSGLPPAVLQTANEPCYSKNDQEGKCVSFQDCQPYMKILSERPILKDHLRLVVNLTCTFDLEEPLICCPLADIVTNPNSLVYRTLQSSGKIINSLPEVVTPNQNTSESFESHPNFNLIPPLTDCSLQRGGGGSETNNFRSRQKVRRGDFPFLALLGNQNPDAQVPEFGCGGSIINQRYILTSAKCVNGGMKPSLVRLGEHDLVNNPDCSNTVGKNRLECSYVKDVLIDNIITHPLYNLTDNMSYFQPNDLALIRLSQNIQFNDFIQPVCLPFRDEYKLSNYPENLENGADTLSVGWSKYPGGQGNTVMRQVSQPIKSNDKCTAFYSRQQPQCDMSDDQICSGGACGADRGGPLLLLLSQKFASSKLFQVGVTSFGPQYCIHGVPSVHTKVTSYLNWILDSIES